MRDPMAPIPKPKARSPMPFGAIQLRRVLGTRARTRAPYRRLLPAWRGGQPRRCQGLARTRVSGSVSDGGFEAWTGSGGAVAPKPGKPSLWVTRERPKIDRVACPWLIRRFIDPDARFIDAPASGSERAKASRKAGAAAWRRLRKRFVPRCARQGFAHTGAWTLRAARRLRRRVEDHSPQDSRYRARVRRLPCAEAGDPRPVTRGRPVDPWSPDETSERATHYLLRF